ncbi:unnamed protein product [Closterium sp. NIES-53]
MKLVYILTIPGPHEASVTDAQGSDDAHRQAPVDRSDVVTGLDLLSSSLAQVDTHEPPADVASPAKIPFKPIDPDRWADCLSAPDFEQERAGESALSGIAPTEALHTFTLDSGALRSFFGDSTTLTPLKRPVAVSLADPSGGPVLAHSSTVLPCPPHSSLFPPTEAPLQTLHMDVWGPARVRGQGHERYFLLVVDDYSRYTSVFPLRSKGDVIETEVVSFPPTS